MFCYNKAFHAQLSMKCILLIIVKMPTIVGILTFISRINNNWLQWFKPESLKFPFVLAISVFMSCLDFILSRAEHEKSFIFLGQVPRL